jgi:Kef-type K+ transport system membrane component KefB
LIGELAQRLGQPAVMGHLIAEVLLGPSVLGALWPKAQHAIFPAGREHMAMLEAVSGLGGQILPDALLPLPDQRLITFLFLGTALSVASVKIVAMVVREMKFISRTAAATLPKNSASPAGRPTPITIRL